jgi:predicted Zn-dependent protease
MSGQAGASRRPAREFTRIALLLLAAGCCCPPPKVDSCPSELELAGDRALLQGRPDEARAIFLQAMRGQQKPFLAWIGVARASIAMRDVQTAQLALAQGMQNDPGTARSADLVGRTLLMLAQELGEAGRSQALMADLMFQKVERLEPKLPKLSYHRGLARLAANEPGPAAILLERAVAEDPNDVRAAQALMLAYGRSGQTERAQAFGETLRRSGRFPEAIEFVPASRPPAPESRPGTD